MNLIGRLDGLSLSELLQMINASARSGTLYVGGLHGSGRIFVQNHRIVYATADTQKRLGYVLVEDGLISLVDLNSALREQAESVPRQPLGVLLVAKGLVEKSALERVLKKHTAHIVRHISTWDQPFYSFEIFSGDEVFPLPAAGLRIDRFLLEEARSRDEVGKGRERETIPGNVDLWP